jgi:predicted GIY-YIG superfamily endonuclease
MPRFTGKPYFLYVLCSVSASRFYAGISENADVRRLQHNAEVCQWTARYAPWELVYVEPHASYSEPRKRELLLKQQAEALALRPQT